MYYQNSIPDPPRNSSLPPQISFSNKECPAKKHSADVGHSRHTPYCSHRERLSQSLPPSFSITQHRIKYAQLARDYTALKRAFATLMYQHAALLRAQSER